jgi:phage tail sheath protein FI
MPEYLAPGVYVEEVSFRAKSIEGVSTTTTAFIGPTRYGPTDIVPDVITSLVEFERIYGDRQPLNFKTAGDRPNYMWHAVQMFFRNGGKRLYISRVFRPGTGSGTSSKNDVVKLAARFPGKAGDMRVRITLTAGPNVRDNSGAFHGLRDFDVVLIDAAPGSPPTPKLRQAKFDTVNGAWTFLGGAASPPEAPPATSVQVVTATVTVTPVDPNIASVVYPDLALDARHTRGGGDDSIQGQFAAKQPSLGRARSIPIVMDLTSFADGLALGQALAQKVAAALLVPTSSDADRSFDVFLTGGDDGELPTQGDYDGVGGAPNDKFKSGFTALEDIDDISIVAAPGSTANFGADPNGRTAIITSLIAHCQKMRYRIGVIDSGDGQTVGDVRDMRGKMDSTYAALYYPWITIFDPVTQKELNVPPSGAVCGIYARNDIERGVFKAPANEVVDGAIGLETILNKGQQDILNPLGVNCFRFFEGRGYRLWGARTISSDPEWKYVNLRRYFAFLEHSIDKGTQWAVFEPNGDRLWANVRQTIVDFLYNEWQNGALLGDKPEKAFFVKCDRSTMTQNDLDNGRLVALVGVAALRPAEYVIIRIGQWTADRKA